jgi:putative transposase
MPPGTQVEVLTPGKNQKHYLAGAWDSQTGVVHHCCRPRKTNQLFRDLLAILATRYPARFYDRVYVVVDNYKIHKAQAVQSWLATQPRFHLLWLPTYCPRANPMERLFGDVHDKVTRNHKRKRLRDLVADVARYFNQNGPWLYRLSTIYQEPTVTTMLNRLRTTQQAA